MKKVSYIGISAILIASTFVFFNQAWASIVVVDSYSESNFSSTQSIKNGFVLGFGQTFNVSNSITLDSVKFYLKKTGSPTGDMVVKIYNISGTYGTNSKPTGNAIATSSVVSASSLTTSLSLVTFAFSGSNRILLNGGTNYAISFEPTDLGSSDFTTIGIDVTSPTHSGNVIYFTSSVKPTTWSSDSTQDCIFYVYGDDTGSSVIVSNDTNNFLTFQ